MIDSGEIRGIFIGSKFPRSLSRVLGLNVTALVHALWISLPGILPTTRTRKLRPSGIFWMDPEVSRPIFTRFTVASLAGFNSLLPARSKTISMKNSRQSSVLLHFNSSAGHGCQGHEKPWNPTSSRGQPNCFFCWAKMYHPIHSYPVLKINTRFQAFFELLSHLHLTSKSKKQLPCLLLQLLMRASQKDTLS